MNLAVRTEASGVLVIELREDNLDASNVREFKETIQPLLLNHANVVLDMDGVKFIDSSGLGSLISCLRQLNARQGDMKLCNLSATVQALFEMMRMQRVFHVHDSLDEALRSFE